MKNYLSHKIVGFICLLLLFCACSSTKHIAEGEYLLDKVKIKADNPSVSLSDVYRNVRQKPNARILLFFRSNLGIYNLSGRNENKSFNKWLRRIGEPPVVYHELMTKYSLTQITNYLNGKGYYYADVTNSVEYKKKKASVTYHISTGERTFIDEVAFKKNDPMNDPMNDPQNDQSTLESILSEESELFREILSDTSHILIKRDEPLDTDLLEQERQRITRMLQENGYFNFSKTFIEYWADTLNVTAKNRARVLLGVINAPQSPQVYRKYKIGNIKINFDYNPMPVVEGDSSFKMAESLYDTLIYGNYTIRYKDKLKVKPKLIVETVQFTHGEFYNISKVVDSYSRLQALNLFRFINIVFKEEKNVTSDSNDVEYTLSCDIQLTLADKHSYDIFLEGTHNSGNFGVGGNFSYNTRNLFRGGENLTMSFWGALKTEKYEGSALFNTHELGVELKLETSQFWLPFFKLRNFRKNQAPRTSMSLAYSNEVTPFYDRQISSAKYGYVWRNTNKRWRYNIDLMDLNYVMMNDVDASFVDNLRSEYIKSAYKSHLILSTSFTASFTDNIVNVPDNYHYFRTNLETSGNLLTALNVAFNTKTTTETENFYESLGVRYAQFVKLDAEYKFNHYINNSNSVIYRFFIGGAVPYGNLFVLPVEEAFFAGGANGIRAWHSRTLGPGSSISTDRYPNSVGEFKLEGNIEYRYKLVKNLGGAFFVDAGNIWNINKYENREGAKLSANFYKQLAVGTGIGLRYDANVFVLRVDWGIKAIDPAKPADQRFVLFNNGKWLRNTVFNLAIGYPF